MDKVLQHLLGTIVQMRRDEEGKKDEDVMKVSETVSAAASAYETVRNTLEYDEEHLLRRNAIRRILKRRLGEADSSVLSTKLLKELIWAKYLPNEEVPTLMAEKVAVILEKYKAMFSALEEETKEGREQYKWLLDVLSTEIEYVLGPPCVDEALASYAYQEMKKRIDWRTKFIKEEDRDLLLYIAIHRTVLKSNLATLRYRLFTLYYPKWRTSDAGSDVVKEITTNLTKVIDSVEGQLSHPASDAMYRFVRRHAVVFHLLADIAQDNPDAFAQAVQQEDLATIDSAVTAAAQERYTKFRTKLRRTVVRATFFLLLTKSILVFLVEYPYEILIIQQADYLPLAVNILFPPLLLAFIGLTVRIPKKKNNAKILEELHGLLGIGEDFGLVFKRSRPWRKGALKMIFSILYGAVFIFTVSLLVSALRAFHFNALSTFFFIFFLSLVAYLGLRIRNTRRDLLVIEQQGGFFRTFVDILFLPIIRAGRWVSLRAPRVNIFLFFFDFIIEAPFKAAIDVIESWLAFLREKREEI